MIDRYINSSQILFELLNITSIEEELLFNRTKSMIDKLMKYFSVEDSTEKTKAYVMEKLFEELRNKKLKKKNSELFTVKEVNILLNIYTHTRRHTYIHTTYIQGGY